MDIVDKITGHLTTVEVDENTLLKAYSLLWENGMILSGDQFVEVVNRLNKFSTFSPSVKCWNLLSEGALFTFHSKYGNSRDKLNEAIEAFRAINDKNGVGAAQALLVIYFKNLGQLDKAQSYVQDAINNLEENKFYMMFLLITYYQAGEISHLLKDYEMAISYLTKGLAFSYNHTPIKTRLIVGLANAYKDLGELDQSFEMFQQALVAIEGQGVSVLESKIYADIANYYFRKDDFEQCIAFHQKSITIREQHKMSNPLVTNYMELAELYQKQNNLDEAIRYASLAEKISEELNLVLKLSQVYLILSSINETLGNTSQALDYYKRYHQRKEEVFSQESARQIKQLSMQHEVENAEKEKELFKLRNVVLKDLLEEIESSVRYAQRIQEAILPPTELIQTKLPGTFVLYQPKDIVAGDFYWMEELDDCLLIAVADCTGHGVPGAMVSVVCSNALNRAVKEFHLTDTGAILDKVTDLVLETFEKSVTDVKDGMDISLLSINKTTQEIRWSGANNPLWYVVNGELKEIKADKQPIGKSDHRKPFTTHVIPYHSGATFYLFTDGFADQFGGPKGKKMMYKKFQEALYGTLNLKPAEQEINLLTLFNDWKEDLEQVDDVCVVGVRI